MGKRKANRAIEDEGSVIIDAPLLPGILLLRSGSCADYHALARFHYRGSPPATWADVWTIRYCPAGSERRVVAVGVLSYPAVNVAWRDEILKIHIRSQRTKARFVNAHVRTISRVVVHPQFRGLGLAVRLVKCLCEHCPTRYVEALAVMGRLHPFFERAGMRRFDPRDEDPDKPIYYLWDREAQAAECEMRA